LVHLKKVTDVVDRKPENKKKSVSRRDKEQVLLGLNGTPPSPYRKRQYGHRALGNFLRKRGSWYLFRDQKIKRYSKLPERNRGKHRREGKGLEKKT